MKRSLITAVAFFALVGQASAYAVHGRISGHENLRLVSEQTFSSSDGFKEISVVLDIDGQHVHGAFWRGRKQCVWEDIRRSVAFRLTTCGDPAHVRLRAASLAGGHRIRLQYRGVK